MAQKQKGVADAVIKAEEGIHRYDGVVYTPPGILPKRYWSGNIALR
jgi:hypothetical protein